MIDAGLLVAAVPTPWWADGATLSWVAIGVAILAAAFTGWQAITAYRARRAETDDSLTRWEAAKWPEAGLLTIRSEGPDEARHVRARLTVEGVSVDFKARRVRQDELLWFPVANLAEAWQRRLGLEPRPGEDWTTGSAFTYGVVIRWRTPRGANRHHEWSGSMYHRIRVEPIQIIFGDTHEPGMPV